MHQQGGVFVHTEGERHIGVVGQAQDPALAAALAEVGVEQAMTEETEAALHVVGQVIAARAGIDAIAQRVIALNSLSQHSRSSQLLQR